MGENEFPFPDFFPEDWGDDFEERPDDADRPEDERTPNRDDAAAERPSEDEQPYPGAELLSGPSPSAIMGRLIQGDPLDVTGRTLRRIRQRAFLIDGERLALRSMAYIAHDAPAYEGRPELAAWIDQLIDRGIKDFLNEDAYEEATGAPLSEPVDDRYRFLVDLLGIPPAKARKACVTFNALPNKDRKAFWAVCVEGKSMHRYVAEGNGPPKRVKKCIERVFQALSFLDDEDGPGFSIEGGFL